MKTKQFFKSFKIKLSKKQTAALATGVFVFLFLVSAVLSGERQSYRYALQNQYRRAFSDLNSNVQNIEASLAKGAVTTDPSALTELASDIYGKAAFAAANLGQLPLSEEELSGTSKFLSQVGDYTYSLSLKYLDGGKITDADYKNLENLSRYAEKMKTALEKMEAGIYSGAMSFGSLQRHAAMLSKNEKALGESVKSLEASFTDYPSLIYDGPFSEHIELADPIFTYNKGEVTREEAEEAAKRILGTKENLAPSGEVKGKIPAYAFTLEDDNKNSTYIEITKSGGYPLLMLGSRFVGDTKIKTEKARKIASDFLKKCGYTNMRESYFEINTNIITINFAYRQGDITVYPDLIKVKIALDDGSVTGLECRGYLMSHCTRDIPKNIISEEEARSRLSPLVTVEEASLAIIPKSSKREVLCYEFKCTHDGKTFLIYLNALTGHEEDVLELIISENGILTL